MGEHKTLKRGKVAVDLDRALGEDGDLGGGVFLVIRVGVELFDVLLVFIVGVHDPHRTGRPVAVDVSRTSGTEGARVNYAS